MFASADDKGTLISWRKYGSQAGMTCTILESVILINAIISSGDLPERCRLIQKLFRHYAYSMTGLLLALLMHLSRYGGCLPWTTIQA